MTVTPVWVDELPTETPETTTEAPTEEWRNIENILFTEEDGTQHPAYRVSNYGNVQALQRPGMRRMFNVAQWIKQGRPHVTLKIRKGITRSVRVDELVLHAFCGERPGPSWGPAYKDNDKTNVELSNLSWERGAGRHHHPQKKAAAATPTETQETTPEETQNDYELFQASVEIESEVLPALPIGEVQEWHRYVLGNIEILTSVGGIDIARLDERGEVIESFSLEPQEADCLRRLIALV